MRQNRLPFNGHYSAALYMRISKDDESIGESASITTQRKMLRAYAMENKFIVYDEYVDDGISGTTFDRPDFKRMIQDIENNRVTMVITKDLSRLGRDYILAGQYTEIYFPSKKVRYIAINDGYDSDSPYTDIAPFKNVINEMYARDTSKKIRSAFVTRMQDGAFIGAFAPYGYKKDPNDKHRLLIDTPAAEVVRGIFSMAAEGRLPIHIARELNGRNVPTPAMQRCEKNKHLDLENYSRRKEWTSGTITKMLRNVVYLGHMAQGKTTKISFKSHITVSNPRDDWFMVENTHEPLISHETFEMATRRCKQRTCEKLGRFNNVFSGVAKCADCGRNMSTVGSRKKNSPANLACGGYKLYGSGECSNHFIDYNILYDIVLSAISEQMQFTNEERQEILCDLRRETRKGQNASVKKKELGQLKMRNRELDSIIEKLYEDNAQGVITAERMKKLIARYEAEASEITERVRVMEQQSQAADECSKPSLDLLQKLLDEYTAVTKLTPDLLYKLIDHIEIGQGYFEKTSYGQVKHQTVKINFRFAGSATIKEYIA